MSSIKKRDDGRYSREVPRRSGQAARQALRQEGRRAALARPGDGRAGDGAVRRARAGKTTFQSYAEGWLARQPHRPGTAWLCERLLRLHVYPTFGARPTGSIRSSDIQSLVTRLGQTLAPKTTENVYQLVKAVFFTAVIDKVLGPPRA